MGGHETAICYMKERLESKTIEWSVKNELEKMIDMSEKDLRDYVSKSIGDLYLTTYQLSEFITINGILYYSK